VQAQKIKALYSAADELAKKYGKHNTMHLGSSHLIEKNGPGPPWFTHRARTDTV